MRDVLVTVLIFGSIPWILRAPANGALMWVLVSVMNPHTQGWGFAQTFPFAQLVAGATLLSLLMARGPRMWPVVPVTVTLLVFVLWMNLTTAFAMYPNAASAQWSKVMKIMLMTFVVAMAIRKREDVHRLIWVLVISLGYYGVKGGLFTIRSGGTQRVWGPPGSFIGDNNEIALALIMTIPLMIYLHQNTAAAWVKRALAASMALTALAAIGSYSRGGLVAITAMLMYVWLRSRHKLAGIALVVLAVPLLLLFMPDAWSERMDSIANYQADSSAQGRINAWVMAYNLARDRILGGGFSLYEPMTFAMYAPDPSGVHAAHSIYFQAMAEHGFIGLALYLLLGWQTWRSTVWTLRHCRGVSALHWAATLAVAIQASMVGFAVGGAFLSLLYFDVPYYLMVAAVVTRLLVARTLSLEHAQICSRYAGV
jgi:putative inorganic carbon (HCO3(-)) transporter